MTQSQNQIGFKRLIRMQRIASHAAALIEKEAEALRECHTLDGDWGEDTEAKAEYEDRIKTAHDLRILTGVVSK